LTSSYQKTAKASAYHWAAATPIISVAALLQLTECCRQLRLLSAGSTPCPTPTPGLCPPALSGAQTAAAPQPTLGSARPSATASNAPAAHRTAPPPSAAS